MGERCKKKLLCILHRSPPNHGAAQVGDYIYSNEKLRENYKCFFITIKSSNSIGEIGEINFKKIYYVIELYIRVFFALLLFRPDKLYFTASIRGVAFARDLIVSTLWKCYRYFKTIDIYYHYHTKGVNKEVENSLINLFLTNFFVSGVNLILLSPLLKGDFCRIKNYKKVYFLPNSVADIFHKVDFKKYIDNKDFSNKNILYLSNMIKEKGYFDVLKQAKIYKDKGVHFHFAGGWENKEDEREFISYVKENDLNSVVTYHGFVSGSQKMELFMKSQLFVFPTRYKNEAFPLSVIEAFSYGVPVVTTNEGSLPLMVSRVSGVVINNAADFNSAFNKALTLLINKKTAHSCRKHYLDNYTMCIFESNLVQIFSN